MRVRGGKKKLKTDESQTDEKSGDVAIACMDFLLKNNLAMILLDKFGGKLSEEYYDRISLPLLSLPVCNDRMIGYAEVVKRKRERKTKKRRRPKLGIGCLCKEALDMLEEYDPDVKKKIPECDTIGFVEVRRVEAAMTPYQQFIKKCMQTKEGDTRNKLGECAKIWKEIKNDSAKLREWGVDIKRPPKLF